MAVGEDIEQRLSQMEDRLLDKLQAHISSISQPGGETGGSGTTPEATGGTGEAQGEQMRWCIGGSRQQTTAATGGARVHMRTAIG